MKPSVVIISLAIRQRQGCGIGASVEIGVAEMAGEDCLDQFAHEAAAIAMGQGDPLAGFSSAHHG